MSFNHVFLDNGQNKAISSESELFLVEPSLSDLVRNLSWLLVQGQHHATDKKLPILANLKQKNESKNVIDVKMKILIYSFFQFS